MTDKIKRSMKNNLLVNRKQWENPEWVTRVMGKVVTECTLEDMLGHGGQSGDIIRLRMKEEYKGEFTAVIKSTKTGKSAQSKYMGLAREVYFYNKFAQKLQPELSCPRIFYGDANMETGEKILIMEDLTDTIQSGYFYGPISPLNYGKDLANLTNELKFSAEDVAAASFEQAAILHAKFWGDESILQCKFLKGADWRCGQGKETWEAWQGMASNGWIKVKATVKDGTCDWQPDPLLIDVVDSSISKISWVDYQEELKKIPLILVHGDCHPGNFMIRKIDKSKPRIIMLDFEAVGVGWSGPAECAQMLISHMEPDTRRKCEDRLLQGYYTKLTSLLIAKGEDSYTFEKCKADYIRFGVARWIWLLAVMGGMNMPGRMLQVFNDQLVSFIKDHGVSPENVSMPGS